MSQNAKYTVIISINGGNSRLTRQIQPTTFRAVSLRFTLLHVAADLRR